MQSHGLHFCSNFASKNIIQSQTTYFFLFLSFSFPFSFLIHFLLFFLATTYFSLYLYHILFSILLFSFSLSRFLSPSESNLAHMFSTPRPSLKQRSQKNLLRISAKWRRKQLGNGSNKKKKTTMTFVRSTQKYVENKLALLRAWALI